MTAKKDSPITLFTGDDEFLVNRHARELVDRIQKADPATELETIDGMVSTVGEAENTILRCKSALQSPGLFSTTRIVWLKDVAFMNDSRPAQSETVQEALSEFVAFLSKGLPEGFSLLITAESIDKRRSFAKGLAKIANTQEFKRNVKDHAARATIVRSTLEENGCSMEPDLIPFFCEKVGTDTRRMVGEVHKVCLYAYPETKIQREDIETITSTTTETAFYALANRFCAFDLTGAIRTLHELLFQRQNVIGLIMHLESTIRDMLVFREALDQGWVQIRGRQIKWGNLPPEVDQALSRMDRDPRKLPFFIAGNLAEGAAKFTRKRLDHCLRQIVLAHEKMVSSRVPPELILEVLLVRMLGRAKKRPLKK